MEPIQFRIHTRSVNIKMGRKGFKKILIVLCHLCSRRAGIQKPFLALHPGVREAGGRLATPPHQKSIRARVTISVVTATFVTVGVWVLVLLRAGVNKSQQISLWATSEIIIMVIAPQKRGTSLRTAQSHQHLFFPTDIALLLSPGWAQSSSSPPEEDASCLSADALITSTVMSLAN